MEISPEVDQLRKAIHNKDSTTVKSLLEKGVDPNAFGMVLPLGLAAHSGSAEVCQLLIDAGASVNLGGRSGGFPLFTATRVGHLDVVKLLISHGAKLDLQYLNGNTALLEATAKGHDEIVKELIRAGSNVHMANNGGDTGLHIAAMAGNKDILLEYLLAGVDVNVVKYEGPKSVSNTGIRPLHLAAYGPNGGHAGIAEILLHWGADVNAAMANGRTALHLAALKNSFRFADVLISHGCEIDPISMETDEHKTPLLKAVDAGHLQMVEKLIDAGADLNAVDRWGVTALLTAVITGKVQIARALIAAGCDLNRPGRNGLSPLKASLRHPPHMTQMLVLAGCHIGLETRSWLEESADKLALSIFPKEKAWLLNETEAPGVLQQQCRNAIRLCLGTQPNKKISVLPIPQRLQDYVALKDLDTFVHAYDGYMASVGIALNL